MFNSFITSNFEIFQLGIRKAFEIVGSDFSGMSEDPLGLYIQDVMQTTVVKVDELGTTAASVTRLSKLPKLRITH